RSPSKAAMRLAPKPLPISVVTTEPVEARTTVTEGAATDGTQMFVPSKTGCTAPTATVTVCLIAPLESRRRRVPPPSVTQVFVPSQRMPTGFEKPSVTVVTLHGSVAPGVTIDTDPPEFAVQIRDPSKVIPAGSTPRPSVTVVTAPAGWVGSIM